MLQMGLSNQSRERKELYSVSSIGRVAVVSVFLELNIIIIITLCNIQLMYAIYIYYDTILGYPRFYFYNTRLNQNLAVSTF